MAESIAIMLHFANLKKFAVVIGHLIMEDAKTANWTASAVALLHFAAALNDFEFNLDLAKEEVATAVRYSGSYPSFAAGIASFAVAFAVGRIGSATFAVGIASASPLECL